MLTVILLAVMTALTINNSSHKILVVGPIYDRLDKLQATEKLMDNYDYIVFNGNLCYPCYDLDKIKQRIDVMNSLIESGKIIYNLGNHDLWLMNDLKSSNSIVKSWLESKPNVTIFNFVNQTSLIITCGGLVPKMNKQDLNDNLEISFVSRLDNKPWHNFYGGGFGYVISNNPLTGCPPTFYNFSAQIGNLYSSEVKVYAQEADQYGLKKTILL